jgi:hypothetical protein
MEQKGGGVFYYPLFISPYLKRRRSMKRLLSLLAVILLVASCAGPQGPVGPQGEQGIQGPAGTDGLDAPQAYVITGYLNASTMNPSGYWEIYNPYNFTAPLATVYVRQNAAQVWWIPIWYSQSNGNIRIINDQSDTHVGYTSISGFEYRIVVLEG